MIPVSLRNMRREMRTARHIPSMFPPSPRDWEAMDRALASFRATEGWAPRPDGQPGLGPWYRIPGGALQADVVRHWIGNELFDPKKHEVTDGRCGDAAGIRGHSAVAGAQRSGGGDGVGGGAPGGEAAGCTREDDRPGVGDAGGPVGTPAAGDGAGGGAGVDGGKRAKGGRRPATAKA